MDAFEAARQKHAKNKERLERTRGNASRETSEEREEEVMQVGRIEFAPVTPAASVSIPKLTPVDSLKEGDIKVSLCFGGKLYEYRFYCPTLQGNANPQNLKDVLLEVMRQKFGRRVEVR